MKRIRPNILEVGPSLYRLDLRSKTFDGVRGVVANGKKSLEFSVKAEAQRKADEIKELVLTFGKQRMETYKTALQIDIGKLQERLTPWNKTIQDAVDFYVDHLTKTDERNRTQTIGVLMPEWLSDKKRELEQNTLSESMYHTLKYKIYGKNGYLNQWADRPIATLTTKEIEEWINNKKVMIDAGGYIEASQLTKRHQKSYLSQFFNWCIRKGYTSTNPCSNITIDVPHVEPICFTPEEAQKIMELCKRKVFVSLLPFHSIGLFAGVRPAECSRLTWDNIDWEDKSIVIRYSQSKTTGRRIPLQPNLYEWLTWFKQNYPTYSLVPPSNVFDKLDYFRYVLKFWKSNGMRHSYASYILGGKIGDYGFLEQTMGNSRKMLQQHYLSFPQKTEADKYWLIKP